MRTPHNIRRDSYGGGGEHHSEGKSKHDHVPSLCYQLDESQVWRAYQTLDHLHHRGKFWNTGKHEESMRYVLTALIGIVQGCVAYFTNITSAALIDAKFAHARDALEGGHYFWAFLRFLMTQLAFAMLASLCVWIEPIAAGSGIPEVSYTWS